jgi:hypothetical protein
MGYNTEHIAATLQELQQRSTDSCVLDSAVSV